MKYERWNILSSCSTKQHTTSCSVGKNMLVSTGSRVAKESEMASSLLLVCSRTRCCTRGKECWILVWEGRLVSQQDSCAGHERNKSLVSTCSRNCSLVCRIHNKLEFYGAGFIILILCTCILLRRMDRYYIPRASFYNTGPLLKFMIPRYIRSRWLRGN